MSREFEVILVDILNREHYDDNDIKYCGGYREHYESLKINLFGNFSRTHLDIIKNEYINFRSLLNKDFERVYIQYLTKIEDRRDAIHIIESKNDLPILNMYYFETDVISELEPFFYYSCLEDIMDNKNPIVYFEKYTDDNIFNTFLHGMVDDHELSTCEDARSLIGQVNGILNYEYYRIQSQLDQANSYKHA